MTIDRRAGRVTMTYEQRLARWERMDAALKAGASLEAIGAAEDPPLTKERVRVILAHKPRPVGRPPKAVTDAEGSPEWRALGST